jgi:hypothetical protein
MPEVPGTLRQARLWAALAGSELTDPESRDLAARAEQQHPGTADMVRAARRFHSGAARQAVARGARLVIFGAAGLPVIPDLHEEAARENPQARFVYASGDETMTLLRRARPAPRCTAVCARVNDPEALLRAAGEDPEHLPPLHVQVVLAALYWPEDRARKVAGRWADLLPAGSSMALSAGTGGDPGDLMLGVAGVCPHPAASVRSWFEDAGMRVTEPGVVPVRTWPAAAVDGRDDGGWQIAGAVAVKD